MGKLNSNMPDQFQSSTFMGSQYAMGLLLDEVSKLDLSSVVNKVSRISTSIGNFAPRINDLSSKVSKLQSKFDPRKYVLFEEYSNFINKMMDFAEEVDNMKQRVSGSSPTARNPDVDTGAIRSDQLLKLIEDLQQRVKNLETDKESMSVKFMRFGWKYVRDARKFISGKPGC